MSGRSEGSSPSATPCPSKWQSTPPEIFVARKRKERARVGHHADKTAQQAEIGERVELPFHALLLIEKPPAAAQLHLAGHRAVLKISDHRGEDIIVGRIDVVEDRPRQLVGVVERAQVGGQRPRLRKIADRIEPAVGSHRAKKTAVRVAQRPEMELQRPALRGVPAAKFEHQKGGVGALLVRRGGLAVPRGRKNPARFRARAGRGGTDRQAVIGETAARRMKIVMPLLERLHQIVEGPDRNRRRLLQALEPRTERRGLIDLQRLVRPVGGIDPDLQPALRDQPVMLQRIGRVVRRAE